MCKTTTRQSTILPLTHPIISIYIIAVIEDNATIHWGNCIVDGKTPGKEKQSTLFHTNKTLILLYISIDSSCI